MVPVVTALVKVGMPLAASVVKLPASVPPVMSDVSAIVPVVAGIVITVAVPAAAVGVSVTSPDVLPKSLILPIVVVFAEDELGRGGCQRVCGGDRLRLIHGRNRVALDREHAGTAGKRVLRGVTQFDWSGCCYLSRRAKFQERRSICERDKVCI